MADANKTTDRERPPMRFSMFSVCDHYPSRARTCEQLYEEILEEIVYAEQLGYYSYWIAEHHFHEYGIVTNPALFLAAAAQRTTTIRLGPSVALLTFRNPLTVAEEYAILDRLSGGRLLMGVGSGYLKHEFEGFAIDIEEKRERFDVSLDILKRAWAGETIVHDAPWFRAGGAKLSVLPGRVPPIYVAVLRREAAYHVGRQGNRLMAMPYASVDRMEEIGALIAEYRKGLDESGVAPDDDDQEVVGLHTYVAESDAEARDHAAAAFDLYVETRLYAKRQVYDDIVRSRLALFGSVDTVVDQLVELYGLGLRHVILLINFGALPAARVRRSMKLIADEVIPRVDARIAAV